MFQSKRLHFICFFLLGALPMLCGQNAQVEAVLTDSLTGQPLEFASWQLKETRFSGTTGLEGTFRILDLPAGKYTLLLNYLGYRPKNYNIQVQPGEQKSLELTMVQEAFEMDEVVVSAQLEGQRAAIQKQINANSIVNIVSKDRIQDIPDQNAAETVGRIPGVSLQREGGEATKVSIRGLSPRYNSITINGERIPATDGNDRSVDLSMVSTDALDGIEVYKSITPDQDGDAVGGTVNFLIKRAKRGLRGNFRGSTGYNQQQDEFGQYRGNLSLSNRYFDNKLGVIVTGNYQRANRSSDILTGSYVTIGEDTTGAAIVNVEDVNLADNIEIRKRYGGSLTLDYELERGAISICSFVGVLDQDQDRFRTRYRPEASRKEYDYRRRIINQFTWNNTLTGTYQLPLWKSELSYGASYALTERNTPTDNTARFRETGAFTGQVDESSLESVVAAAKNDFERTFFQQDRLDTEDISTRKYTGNVDWKIPFQNGSDSFSGFLKMGAKVRLQSRNRESFRLWSAFGAIDEIAETYPERFQLNSDDRITIAEFTGTHDEGVFLQNRFPFGLGPTLDAEKLQAFTNTYKDEFYSEDERQRLQNYDADEDIRAAYLMSKLTFFERLTIIPGVRVENTQTRFEGLFGRSFELEGQVLISSQDTVGRQNYTEFLPMVQAKYQVKPWMDVRLAATRTLARPNFFDLVPWQQIDDINGIVQRGNANLEHTTAWNYDAFFSFYNKYGLFTVGGFHKRLQNVDYTRVTRDLDPASTTTGYRLITQENLPAEVTVFGAEFDLQANLTFLPKPFNGIVLSANYTFINSETLFPQLKVIDGEPPFFIPTVVDTFRQGVLPDQPDNVLNLSLGYEVGGFSARVSVVRQGTTLQFVGDRVELDGFFRAFSRWDLAVKQKLKNGISLFLNFNNITNTPEFVFLAADQRFPIEEEYFGWTADLGMSYKF
ncbi:MAG: TonB-dependent receptor [Phaeodactylibacter xiamenensis]|uniref:TonB-dependent receptor n=1 Tax=Phaeodactylibacter xiamenensis TaxID=1524460 RepID=A0A098S789_9BACT|nr:TonB-dependent receptor [Phaeodactylibacter xiamenensis]KGE86972.1 hypothetical protein IX84_18210 [Phaeodactylibacter xiamenensis]MCR9050579.1 TonB-dependent receptor [bacterium]